VDTAALTGETIPRKIPSPQYGNTMLSGCVVKVGEGFCRVDTTGVNTEIGMGMAAIQEHSGVQMGFFEKKIMAVVAGIIGITLVDIVALTILECFYRGRPLYSSSPDAVLLWDLAIMVAAVPIALPLVIQVFASCLLIKCFNLSCMSFSLSFQINTSNIFHTNTHIYTFFFFEGDHGYRCLHNG
jgi:magnesium-transporting ATPase (P-type)